MDGWLRDSLVRLAGWPNSMRNIAKFSQGEFIGVVISSMLNIDKLNIIQLNTDADMILEYVA